MTNKTCFGTKNAYIIPELEGGRTVTAQPFSTCFEVTYSLLPQMKHKVKFKKKKE